MIISHRYKYLFVELPLTGSTAISNELRENYDGTEILFKHSTYYDFLKIATEEEKNYFVFAGIRNPLDQAVSHYFKFKTDHKAQFTKNNRFKRKGINRLAYAYSHMARFNFVQNNNADFATFFLKFYKIPYNNWSSMAHKDFDFVLHFENLAADFAKVIDLLELDLKRPLPVKNQTAQKNKNFVTYYNSPEVIKRAQWVFGPYMKQWGYDFPPEWGENKISWWQQAEFEFFNIFRNFYWKYMRRPYPNTRRPASQQKSY